MATLDSDDLTAIENLINASVDGVLAKLPGSGRAATLAEIWPNGVRDLNDYGALLVAIGLLFDDLVDTDLTDLLQEIQGLLEDGVTLQTSAKNALIAAIDAALLNDGDGTDFIAGLISRLGNENIDAVVLAGVLKAALFHADDVGNKLRVSTAGEVSVDAEVSLEVDVDALAETIITALRPGAASFTGGVALPAGETLRLFQRDDYAAADGRAYEWSIVNAAIDFTDATVVAGGGQQPGVPLIGATPSLHDKADGSCTLRLEFTSTHLDRPASTYQFDAHILVGGRRVTVVNPTIQLRPKFADAPPS